MPYGSIDGQINAVSSTLSASATTTSTTVVSSGFGITIGSQYTGRYLIIATVSADHSVIDSQVIFSIYRVAGSTIPTNGSAVTGTQLLTGTATSPSATGTETLILSTLDSIGIGTYSYYLAYFAGVAGTAAIRGGTASNTGTTITAIEV